MPRRRMFFPLLLAGLFVVSLLPVPARGGDRPILVARNWGVGEIDGRILLYAGPGHYVETPIPTPPRGPRWDKAYAAFPILAIAGAGLWLCRRKSRARREQA